MTFSSACSGSTLSGLAFHKSKKKRPPVSRRPSRFRTTWRDYMPFVVFVVVVVVVVVLPPIVVVVLFVAVLSMAGGMPFMSGAMVSLPIVVPLSMAGALAVLLA